jgi:PKD repeat protein
VAVGDFNGDGRQDLAVASDFSNTVSVLLGKGDGTFQTPVNYAAGSDADSVAVGDFNGDGRQDLAVANAGSNSVSVLLGKGDGTFQTPINYAVGSGPVSVAVGDFNGDGKQDLATANQFGGTVSVLLGKGDGTFQTAVNYAAGNGPHSVAVGDFNSDGKQDLAVANADSNSVSVLLGKGDGSFQSAVDYAVGTNPISVAVGDFNGDGEQDLVTANADSNSVSVLLGKDDGTFQTAVNYDTGDLAQSVAVGDFNGDGKQDLAVANTDNIVSVLLGKGNGTFQTPINYAAGTFPEFVAVGDFNGDGKQDLAVADPGRDTVNVLLNQPGAAPVIATGGGPVTDTEGLGTTVAIFTDPTGPGYLTNYRATLTNANDLSVTAAPLFFDSFTNLFFVEVPVTLEEGTYPLTITIYKSGSLAPPVMVNRVLTIVDQPVVLTGRSLSATEGAPVTGALANFIDLGNSPPSDFTATIAWGDGSTTAGTVTQADRGLTVSGSHTYARAGSYTPHVTVTDEGDTSSAVDIPLQVRDASLLPAARTVSFVAGQLLSRTVGSFADADPAGFAGLYTATIDWGDGTPATPGTVAANGSGFDLSGSHTYPRAGTYTVRATVQDAGGATTTIVSTAVVADPPLSAQGRVFAVTGSTGTSPKNLSNVSVATFSDPDPHKDPTLYAATIDWGDGSPATAGTISGANPFTVTGTHSYAPFADAKIITVTITGPLNRSVTVTSRVVDPPADPPSNRTFVQQLYQDLLGRPAEDAGLAFWSGLLDQGFPRQQVVAGVLGSLEYRVRVVQGLYQHLLRREADANGLQTFTDLLAQKGTLEAVQAALIGSDEYFQSRAGGTVDGFLTALYQDGLNRPLDAVGRARFTQDLAAGASHAQVAAVVFASDEYRQDLVDGYYQRFLQRPADGASLAGFVGALAQGASDEDVVAALLSSPEYFNRV